MNQQDNEETFPRAVSNYFVISWLTLAGETSCWVCSVWTRTHLDLGSWQLEVTISSCDPSFLNPCGHVLDMSLAGSSSATGRFGTCLSSLVGRLPDDCPPPPLSVSPDSWEDFISVIPSELKRSTFTLKSLMTGFTGAIGLVPAYSTFLIFAGLGPSLALLLADFPLLNFPSKFWWCFSSSKARFQAVERFIW